METAAIFLVNTFVPWCHFRCRHRALGSYLDPGSGDPTLAEPMRVHVLWIYSLHPRVLIGDRLLNSVQVPLRRLLLYKVQVAFR